MQLSPRSAGCVFVFNGLRWRRLVEEGIADPVHDRRHSCPGSREQGSCCRTRAATAWRSARKRPRSPSQHPSLMAALTQVSVTQPSKPAQSCLVTSASGMAMGDVTNR